MRKVHANGPGEVLALGRNGVFGISMTLAEHWSNVEALLRKYSDRPISLANACLIRSAEIHHEARILTFDTDFRVYRVVANEKIPDDRVTLPRTPRAGS
jgi:uncharacterized protein